MATVAVNVRAIPGPQVRPGEGSNRAAGLFSGREMTEGCDWGTGRLLAYAHHTLVVVVDPGSNQVVQTLDGHQAVTTAVRFMSSTSDVLLATGDASGCIIVWQVREGTPIVTMSCAVNDHLKIDDTVLAVRQVKLPSKTTNVSHLVPFRLLCLTARSLTLLDPSSQSTLWRSEMGSQEHPLVGLTLSARENCIVYNNSSDLRIIPKVGTSGASYHSTHLSVAQYGELQDVVHCPSVKSQVYLVFRTEIILYDIEIKKQIANFSISSGRTEFRSLITASGAELSAISTVLGLSGPLPLYTLHNDGTMSTWVRSPGGKKLLQVPVDFRSSRQGFSGRPHLVAMERVQGAEIGHNIEGCRARFAVIANDGTLTTWEYSTDGWCISGITPSTLSPVACASVMRLDISASETKMPGTDPNCLVLLTMSGVLMVYEILTGALICKLELVTERGTTPLSVQCLNANTILVAATKQGATSDSHHNYIASVMLPSLNTDEFKGVEVDGYKLLGIEVSPRRLLLAALHTGGACEIWDIPAKLLMQKIVVSSTIIKWMPAMFTQNKDPEQAGEIAIWLSQDGLMSFFKVVNGEVRHYRENPSFMNTKTKSIVGFGYPVVWADWYDGLLLTGDSAGMMCLVNLKNGKFSHIDNQQKAAVKALKICPPEYFKQSGDEEEKEGKKRGGACLALVLFEDEEFGVWNVGAKQRLSYSKSNDGRHRPLKATAIDWAPGGYPIIATTSGTVMILDLSFGPRSSAVTLRSLARPLCTTALLVRPHAAYLTACLMDCQLDPTVPPPTPETRLQDTSSVPPPYRNAYGELVLKTIESAAEEAALHLQLISGAVKDGLKEHSDDTEDGSLLRRYLITAAILADEERMQFWRCADIALRETKGAPRPRFIHPTIISKEQTLNAFSKDAAFAKKLLGGDHEEGKDDAPTTDQEESKNNTPNTDEVKPRETCGNYFDTDMMEGGSIGAHDELFLDDGLLHAVDCNLMSAKEDAVRATKATHQYDVIAKQHVNLGAMYPACQLLLDTPMDAPEWRANLYKACVVAAGVSPLHYQHTVKRVAGMLVGNGDIDGAVEMLCLVGRGHEACRALQTHDRWEDAARLAKVSLTKVEANDILKRWAQHLSMTSEALTAACIMVSTGDFLETLRLLAPHAEFCDVAAPLAWACEQAEILTTTMPTADDVAPLIAAIYSQYKEYLNSISAHHIAELYNTRLLKWKI